MLPEAKVVGSGRCEVAFEVKGFVTTPMSSFSDPLFLDFGDFNRVLERCASKGGEGYPPYNIERFAETDDREEILRITLAVAGFRADDLEVEITNNQLVIRGERADDLVRTYLFKGIAARRFQRSFVLGGGLQVRGADLRNGLLTIDLVRPTVDRSARTIAITRSG